MHERGQLQQQAHLTTISEVEQEFHESSLTSCGISFGYDIILFFRLTSTRTCHQSSLSCKVKRHILHLHLKIFNT